MEERQPYGSFAGSAALHGALVAAILFGFTTAPRFSDSPEAIPIETVSLSDLNRIMNGEKTAKPEPEPASPQPRQDQRASAPPPPPEPAPPPPKPAPPSPKADATPPPEPPPRPSDQPAPEPTPKLAAKEAPAVEPPIRPKPPREKPKPARNFDPNAIARLIGEDKMATPAIAPTETASATPQGLPRHDAPRMSMSMASALDAWLTETYFSCWSPPPTMPDGDTYVAEIRVVFKPDGSLQGRPVLVNPPSDRAWRPHAESAMRAVRKCDPLKIPAEYMPYFDQWKIETIHFDPRETQG